MARRVRLGATNTWHGGPERYTHGEPFPGAS